jgi:2Fe-2S ferredoxin
MYGSFLCNKGSYMPKINYITTDGERHEIEVDQGYTVMEGAVNNDIDGIPAECGGACACATCHAYVDQEWLPKLPAMDDMEDSMLDAAYERRDNSRLTCQIEVTNELDGLIVHIAENEC